TGATCSSINDETTGSRAYTLAAMAQARADLQEATLRATLEGERAVTNEDHYIVTRLNPARCQCPPAEVLAAGVWTRSWLIWSPPDPEREARLELKAREPGAPLYLVLGRFTTERNEAPNAIDYPVVQVTRILNVGSIAPQTALELARTYNTTSETLNPTPPTPTPRPPAKTPPRSPSTPPTNNQPNNSTSLHDEPSQEESSKEASPLEDSQGAASQDASPQDVSSPHAPSLEASPQDTSPEVFSQEEVSEPTPNTPP
ncbi:MAG: hypothetical protein AAFX99_32060, partial [Myxococcota bacterium]